MAYKIDVKFMMLPYRFQDLGGICCRTALALSISTAMSSSIYEGTFWVDCKRLFNASLSSSIFSWSVIFTPFRVEFFLRGRKVCGTHPRGDIIPSQLHTTCLLYCLHDGWVFTGIMRSAYSLFGICFLTAIVFVVHVYPDLGQSVFLASIGIAFGGNHQAESPIKLNRPHSRTHLLH